MIFRKENRGESFQRQITNLRQQLQSDIDDEPDDSSFDEPEAEESKETPTSSWEDNRSTSRGSDVTPTSSFPVAEQPSARPSWQTTDATTSIIASNAYWNGTLQSEGSLHIHGRAEGELVAVKDLYIAEGAKVDAEILAENVVVAGAVRGQIEARNRLEVLPEGHVAGDVKAQKLVIHEGARLAGHLRMGTSSASSADTSTSQSSGSRQSKSQYGGR